MNKKLLFWILAILIFFPSIINAQNVSIISLIVNPEKYENKRIIVSGVAGLSFEVSNLFLDEWSYTHGVIANSICLGTDFKTKYNKFDGKALAILGKFEKDKNCGYVLLIENIAIRQPEATEQ